MSRCQQLEQHTPEHSSPARVLARFFEKSRDGWKAKYMRLQGHIRAARTESRDLRRSRDRWRAKAEALEKKIEHLRTKLEEHAEQSPPAPSRLS
jgi:septal ring factor EnvC (AmiA/AmiB activator)